MFTVFHAFALKSAPHVELRVREENAAAIALYRSIRMQTIAREPG
jgi:ribosomal protein S18 acetylase RimI-like enzyme